MRNRHRPFLPGLLVVLLAVLVAAAPATASTAIVVKHGDRGSKRIALTFDDGWSAKRTARIVRILDSYGVTATFFPYGKAIELDPQMWRSIAGRFPVGNHTLNHKRLTGLSAGGVYAEIDGGRRAFERLTGRRMARLFRPPFGAHNSTVAREAYRAGYRQIVMWDVDSRDWKRPGDDVVYRRATAGENGSIILLHAGPATTVRVLPAIIEYYLKRGYRFVTVPEMLGMDWSPKPAVKIATTVSRPPTPARHTPAHRTATPM